MEIVAIGIDATDIPRIESSIARHGLRFLHRIFTEGERAYCDRRRRPAVHYATRFAAKEAGMKALGTGHSQGVLWRDLEVVRVSGPPELRFHGAALAHLHRLGADRSLLTLTHSDALAIAQVLLLSPP
jgi:holo-[acyl-carrier protein] synthase